MSHPDNTRTPLITWGAGISPAKKASPGKVAPGHDSFSKNWDLTSVERKDVKQADIAPLMASLIGVPFPMNSVGTLPLEYLDASPEFKAKAALVNAKQILAQYLLKHNQKRSTEFHFVPYQPLHQLSRPIDVRLDEIHKAISSKEYDLAEHHCSELIQLCLEGLRYFQRYDWLLLRTIVSTGYIGWIMYSLVFILKTYIAPASLATQKAGSRSINLSIKSQSSPVESETQTGKFLNAVAGIVLLLFCFVFYHQQAPWLYYAYLIFPIYFWLEVFKQTSCIRLALSSYLGPANPKWKLPLLTAIYIAMLEAMVYGYFDRRFYSVGLVLMGVGWVLSFPASFRSANIHLVIGWLVLCFGTAIFTILPVVKDGSPVLVLLSGLAIAFSGALAFIQRHRFISSTNHQNPKTYSPAQAKRIAKYDIIVLAAQICIISVATVLVYITQLHLDSKDTVSTSDSSNPSNAEGTTVLTICRLILWVLFLVSPIVPFVQLTHHSRQGLNPHFFHRLITIYLAFATPFQILTISYESWFYLCFSGILTLWLMMERNSYRFDLESIPLATADKSASSVGRIEPSYTINSQGANNIVINSSASAKRAQNPDPTYRALSIRDARTALFFLMFINIAFFGTGNVTSLASFNLKSVFRLITVFSPFIMTVILVFKILIPFFLLSAVFGVLNKSLDLPPFSLFLVVLSTTDIMTLNFFFLVRDEGSWLDIGMSISHFCISSLFVLLSIILFVLSHALVGRVLVPSSSRSGGFHQKKQVKTN